MFQEKLYNSESNPNAFNIVFLSERTLLERLNSVNNRINDIRAGTALAVNLEGCLSEPGHGLGWHEDGLAWRLQESWQNSNLQTKCVIVGPNTRSKKIFIQCLNFKHSLDLCSSFHLWINRYIYCLTILTTSIPLIVLLA